jgi:molecular chaperone GrpE
VRSAGRDVTESLLPVLDDFERAMAASEGQDLEQMREGYLLIGQKMRGILEARGLQRMEAKGAEFDTDLHEAITQIPAPEPQMKGKVVDVVEPGYKLHDNVLRFAKVVVGN